MHRVIEVKNRVKNRLEFEAWRKGTHFEFFDQAQFGNTNGTIKGHLPKAFLLPAMNAVTVGSL